MTIPEIVAQFEDLAHDWLRQQTAGGFYANRGA